MTVLHILSGMETKGQMLLHAWRYFQHWPEWVTGICALTGIRCVNDKESDPQPFNSNIKLKLISVNHEDVLNLGVLAMLSWAHHLLSIHHAPYAHSAPRVVGKNYIHPNTFLLHLARMPVDSNYANIFSVSVASKPNLRA